MRYELAYAQFRDYMRRRIARYWSLGFINRVWPTEVD